MPQKSGKPLAAPDMRALPARRKLTGIHVLDHTAAKNTDPLGHHGYSLIEVHTPILGKSPGGFSTRVQWEIAAQPELHIQISRSDLVPWHGPVSLAVGAECPKLPTRAARTAIAPLERPLP